MKSFRFGLIMMIGMFTMTVFGATTEPAAKSKATITLDVLHPAIVANVAIDLPAIAVDVFSKPEISEEMICAGYDSKTITNNFIPVDDVGWRTRATESINLDTGPPLI